MSKSLISRGGIAPPQGLMRPLLSMSATLRPRFARSLAAVAPAGPPPTTTMSKTSSTSMAAAPSQGLVEIAPGRRQDGTAGSRRMAAHSGAPQKPPQPGTASRRPKKRSNTRRLAAQTRPRAPSTSSVAKTPPRPKAIACAAPQSPIRVPSRDAARAPAPARPIIEPIDATAKAPLETPSANTAATNTRGSAERKPLAAIPAKDNPDATQPPTVQRRKEPKIGPPVDRRSGDRDAEHAGQHASVLQAGEFCRHARRHSEHQPGERLDQQLLGAEGEHRHEDEDGEAARRRVIPLLSQRRRESGLARRRRPLCRRRRARRPQRPRPPEPRREMRPR